MNPPLIVAASASLIDPEVLKQVASGGAIVVGAILIMLTFGIYSAVAKNKNPGPGQLQLVKMVGFFGLSFFVLSIAVEFMKPPLVATNVNLRALSLPVQGGIIKAELTHPKGLNEKVEIADDTKVLGTVNSDSMLMLDLSNIKERFDVEITKARNAGDAKAKILAETPTAKADTGRGVTER